MLLTDLIITDKTSVALEDMMLPPEHRAAIDQFLKEHRYRAELQAYGLPVNNKLLLYGHSGCGKTTTAKAIAHRLGKPLLILNLSNVVNSRIGETSQNIRQVFDKAAREKSVLFLDELDQIGKARDHEDKDVGEMRRLVNTLIQLIDYFPEDALLLAATNQASVIDSAIWRRFQLRIPFEQPSEEQLDQYYDHILAKFPEDLKRIERLYGISYAEAKDSAYTRIKRILLEQLESGQKSVPENL
ncbi:MAG: ATPase [Bacteroidetes bacterium 47-18]|nr:MAG: ATPase [Bacteroidetes bacterium 47-18]